MKTSLDGLGLIKHFEGLRLEAYDDATGLAVAPGARVQGILTNGYGHTGADVCAGQTCTEQQAHAWLVHDTAVAERVIDAAVRTPLTQNQFDALVSFVFNVGPGRAGRDGKDGFVVLRSGKPSTLLRCLNLGDYAGAAGQFPLWTRAQGRVLKGLVKRREAERAWFEGRPWRA